MPIWQSHSFLLGALVAVRGWVMHEILLIEDSDSDAQLVERALRQARVTNPIVRVVDGSSALEYLVRIERAFETGTPPAPSVLLLDLKLPGISGFEILADIKNRAAFSKTLKVVFSDLQSTEEIKRAYAAGAQSFLTKPVQADDLRELIITFPDYWLLE